MLRESKTTHIQNWLVFACFLIFFLTIKNAQAIEPTPNVMILNGYHQGEDWSDNQIKGLQTVLQKSFPFLVPSIEDLDTKRFPDPSHLQLVQQYLKNKYDGKQFDLIITLDNSALNLMLKFGDDLFPGVPIVFAGVNGYSPDMLKGHPNITGVAEVQDMMGTLDLAVKINPDIQTILAVHDYTASGFAVRRGMESVAEKFKGSAVIKYTPEGSVEDLVKQLKALRKDTAVMLLTYVTDKNGKTLTREESTRIITSSSPVPVYAMHETRLGYGIVGGMLLEGVEHGKQAGEIALRILSGETPDSIKVATSHSRTIFDYQQLARFNIPIKRLPENSTIINQPVSFWNKHQPVLLPGSILLGLLIATLFAMSFFILRIRRADRAVRESEQKTRSVVNAIPDMMFTLQKDGLITDYKVHSERELYRPIDRNSGTNVKDIMPLEFVDKIMTGIERTLDTGKLYFLEYQLPFPDGNRDFEARLIPTGENEVLAIVRDFTEQKQAEKLLRFQAHLLDAVEQSVIATDLRGAITYWNPFAERLYGWNETEVLGRDIMDVTVSEYSKSQASDIMTQLNKDQSWSGEFQVQNKDGDRFYAAVTNSTLKDSDGNITGFIGVSYDITERKRTERSLQESEEKFRALFHASPLPTYTWQQLDDDFVLQDYNSAALTFTDGAIVDLIGIKASEMYRGQEQVPQDFRHCFEQKTIIEKEMDYELKTSGKSKYLNVKYAYVAPDQLMVQTEDFTERKKSEDTLKTFHEMFLTVLNSIDATIYVADMDTYEILFMNKTMVNSFGRDMTGEVCWEVFRGESGPCSCCTNDKLIDEDGKPTDVCVWHDSNPITGKWYINHDRAIEWTDGRIVRIQIATDISEFKKMESQLQQAQKMEAIGNLAGGIAHDFNNILSSIIGFTELALEAAPQGSAQKDDLEEVFIAGKRAKELVQQILAFARQSEKETKPVKLGDTVTEVLKLLRPSTPTSIDIKATINSTKKVMGDSSQLHQIVMNICTNSIHSLQKSGSILEIAMRDIYLEKDSEPETSTLPSGEYVELSIVDNGPGIDPTIIDNIFEPYFTTKGVGEGTGMGLAMVKGIVESYGGDIQVKSQPGQKTSFVIRFPAASGKSVKERDNSHPAASGTERILFVDDEPPIARMGSRMLESLGYTVTMRTSSFEALELFREKPDAFDLVITDMTMPSMTGDALSKEMRKIRHDIPIILCTGYSNKINDQGAKQIGINAFAYKPFAKSDFAKTIREVLDA